MRTKTRISIELPAERLQIISIPLPELDCPSCARRLRRHLNRIEGLRFELSLTARRVDLEPGSSPAAIHEALSAIRTNGYDPRAASVLLPLFDLPLGSTAPSDIENTLGALAGVLRSSADPLSQMVEVWYVPGETDIAEIRQQIRITGHRTEPPVGPAEISERLDRLHRRSRLEAIAAVIASMFVTFLSIPFAAENSPTVDEEIVSASRGLMQSVVPQLFDIDPIGLELFLLFFTFGFLIWLGRGWMESGSFALLGRNPDSNTTAAAAVFVLAAGLTIASIRVAWKADVSYAFPGYATLFWMIALYSLARLIESRERRRIRAKNSDQGRNSTLRSTEIQRRAETTLSIVLRVVICVAIAAFVLWFDLAPETPLLYAVIAFAAAMIVTTPGIFGLAVPSALTAGIEEAARRGVIVRSARAFEDLSRVRKVAVQKEKIITEGRFATSDFVLLGGIEQRELLTAAAALARLADSELARAVVARAGSLGTFPRVSDFEEFPGSGFRGRVDGRDIIAGKPGFVQERGFSLDPVSEELTRYGSEGKNSLVMVIEGTLAGMIALRDAPLEGAAEAVARLTGLGVTVHLFGSDEASVLEAIAARAGIREVTGDIEPRLMRGALADAKENGGLLAVICAEGDQGLLFTAADLPISMTAAVAGAGDSASVILTGGGLGLLADSIAISRASLSAAARNIRWGIGYHAVAILFATQILHPIFGMLISPAVFALAMFSALIVAIWNGRRFEREAAAI